MDKNFKQRRRYSAAEKAVAVRMVGTLQVELGAGRRTQLRMAGHSGHGPVSVRSWARQSDIDEGRREGVPAAAAAEIHHWSIWPPRFRLKSPLTENQGRYSQRLDLKREPGQWE
jgi:hypothetical protein